MLARALEELVGRAKLHPEDDTTRDFVEPVSAAAEAGFAGVLGDCCRIKFGVLARLLLLRCVAGLRSCGDL